MGVNERPKRKNAGSKMTAIVSKEKEIDGNDIHETSSSDSNKTTEAIIHPDDNEDEPHIGIFQTPEIPDEVTYILTFSHCLKGCHLLACTTPLFQRIIN